MISERTEILYFFILYPSQRAKILLQSSVETPNSDNTHIIVVNLERKRFLSWRKVGTKISRCKLPYISGQSKLDVFQ